MQYCENIKINGECYSKNRFLNLASENKGILSEVFSFLVEWNSEANAIFQKTSGSTGAPKLIPLKKEMMLASAVTTCEYFGLNEFSKLHLCLPAAFVAGKMMAIRAIVSGGELVIEEPSLTPLKKDLGNLTFSAMTPVQFSNCYMNDGTVFNNISTIILGGGEVSSSQQEIVKMITAKVFSTYGMTETASHVAIKNLTDNETEFSAIGDAQFTVDDRNCLCISSKSLDIDCLQTNDIVELTSPYKFNWKGRADRIINSGGVKISPEDIEQEIGSRIKVSCFIFSIPNEFLGEELCIAIEDSIIEYDVYLEKLSSMNLKLTPRKIFLKEKFLYTDSGKIDRLKTIVILLDA